MARRKNASVPRDIRDLLRSRLCWGVAACAFVFLAVLQLGVILGSHEQRQANLTERLDAKVADLVGASLDNRGRHDLYDIIRMGEGLVRFTPVEGAVIVDAIGTELSRFGTQPELTWIQATKMVRPYVLRSGAERFETFLSADRLRLDHGLLVRYDAGPELTQLKDELVGEALLGAVLAVPLAVAFAAGFGWFVLLPLIAMRRAAEETLQDPQTWRGTGLRNPAGPELGRLFNAMQELRAAVATAMSGDLSPNEAWLHAMPGAAIFVSDHGFITLANEDALTLFAADDDETLAAQIDGGMLHLEGVQVSLAEIVSRDRFASTCTIHLGGQETPCLIACQPLHRPNGSVQAYLIQFTDVTGMVSEMSHETARRRSLEEAVARKDRRLAEMRQLFDCCLILLDRTMAATDAAPVTVLPDTLISAWLRDMREQERIEESAIQFNSLPAIIGCPSTSRKLFRLLLTAMLERSLQEQPEFVVQASIKDPDTAHFEMREVQESADGAGCRLAGDSAEAPVLIAAAARLATILGGEVVRWAGGSDNQLNEIHLEMPLDTVTMRAIVEDDAPDDLPGVEQLTGASVA